MTAVKHQREEAARLMAEAIRLRGRGENAQAIPPARRAALLYAAADGAEEEAAGAGLRRERADACRLCADILMEEAQWPEAATLYQEAADLYAREGGEEAEQEARACAHRVMEAVNALRARPRERLYLLIAHHERRQRQLALEPGTEAEQAQTACDIARVFQRRERPAEAVERFQEALALYARAPQTPENLLACAECHHRLATVLYYDLQRLSEAAEQYRAAIALYALHEPHVFGEQASRALCARALAEIERRLADVAPRPSETRGPETEPRERE